MAEKKIMNFAQALKIRPGSLRPEPEVQPVEEDKSAGAAPPPPSSDSPGGAPTSATTSTPKIEAEHSIAPARDFTRVANSIVRNAVASGVFSGKSKQVYDYLYSQTRGAITPQRSFRIPMDKLRINSGLGSDKSLRSILERLTMSGLVIIRRIAGTQGGNEFIVFLPEEVGVSTPTPTPTPTPTTTGTFYHLYPSQKVVGVEVVESTSGSRGLSLAESTTSGDHKTSFKTNTKTYDDDDAGARRLTQKLIQTERELTGKVTTSAERWDELAELLDTELRIAAARTTVSNVPAFLTEHLRRRLWKVDKQRATEIAAASEQGTQTPALSEEEKRRCPDCAGTGFWYPEGTEKGVAKCLHHRLESGRPEKEK